LVRQGVASEILDRILGKPTQRQEVTGAEGGPVRSEVVVTWDNVIEVEDNVIEVDEGGAA
jgi:hypothetical protein